jgi:hypothetical protein
MHVVGHQAVAPDLEAVSLGVFPEGLQVGFPIPVFEKDRTPAAAALGDVVRAADSDYSHFSGHTEEWWREPRRLRKRGYLLLSPFPARVTVRSRLPVSGRGGF